MAIKEIIGMQNLEQGMKIIQKLVIAWDKYRDFDYLDYNRVVKYCLK